MSETPLEAIQRLERVAAWHRINAERAGAGWVWEARLRTAEHLERRAAKIRAQLSSGDGVQIEIAAFLAPGPEASEDIGNVKRWCKGEVT
jgi:hypothetical protein